MAQFITAFADARLRGWDHDTGFPTCQHFGNALQVWAIAQNRPVTIDEAALAFNVSPDLVRTAIEEHHWMYEYRGGFIGHDGE